MFPLIRGLAFKHYALSDFFFFNFFFYEKEFNTDLIVAW